jgi:hypothetical protein
LKEQQGRKRLLGAVNHLSIAGHLRHFRQNRHPIFFVLRFDLILQAKVSDCGQGKMCGGDWPFSRNK